MEKIPFRDFARQPPLLSNARSSFAFAKHEVVEKFLVRRGVLLSSQKEERRFSEKGSGSDEQSDSRPFSRR
jgi:hypothetical protein